mmetsp:Transcript_31907/g.77762  ORF Transcript_31907/g.77762 Transcript_31907/m.77762 type:complete len:324 (-) Transcript_31907:138-1109(-)
MRENAYSLELLIFSMASLSFLSNYASAEPHKREHFRRSGPHHNYNFGLLEHNHLHLNASLPPSTLNFSLTTTNKPHPWKRLRGAVSARQSSGEKKLLSRTDSLGTLKVALISTTVNQGLPCSRCRDNRTFSSKQALRNHILNVHEGMKGFQCPLCNKTFGQRFEMKVHMMGHTGEKNHSCPHCRRRFATKQLLRIHTFHLHMDMRPYNCTICKRRFKMKQQLEVHNRTHNPREYKCGICSKWFTTPYILKIHQRTHTGSKPYCCNYCGYTCSDRSNLIKHVKNTWKCQVKRVRNTSTVKISRLQREREAVNVADWLAKRTAWG